MQIGTSFLLSNSGSVRQNKRDSDIKPAPDSPTSHGRLSFSLKRAMQAFAVFMLDLTTGNHDLGSSGSGVSATSNRIAWISPPEASVILSMIKSASCSDSPQ